MTSNSTRLCVFCQERPGNTQEDVWPLWLQAFNAPVRGETVLQHEVSIHEPNYLPTPTTVKKIRRRNGAAETVKVRIVCSRCNNGWMSVWEQSAKKELLHLVEPLPLDCTLLEPEQQKVLARWAHLKSLMMEATNHTTQTSESSVFRSLYENRVPGPGISVGLFALQDQVPWTLHYKHAGSRAIAPGSPFDHSMSSVTFSAGRVGFYVYNRGTVPQELDLFQLCLEQYAGLQQIWPPLHPTILYPPPPTLPVVDCVGLADRVRSIIDEIRQAMLETGAELR